MRIKAVYLFGSAVRGELEKKSDLDLFLDCAKKDEERVRQLANSALIKFTSSRDYEKWKLLRFTYPFSCTIGQLAEWDLKLSLASEGILLYSSRRILSEGERKVLFTITYPPRKRDYIRVRRLLFGRDEEEYRDTGLISALNGKKISSTVFLIPQDEQTRMAEILAKEKVPFSMQEIVHLEA